MKLKNVVLAGTLFLTLCIWVSCSKENAKVVISSGTDPNFKIVPNNDKILTSFNRKVEVFGISIYAVKDVKDANLLHAANVMAQYLDNDEDGTIDNQLIVDKMIENKAFVVMWKKESDLNISPPDNQLGQDLGDDETNPNFVSNEKTGRFDAALEEIWHIISHSGYAYAYPSVFGENEGTELSNAMDIARGGKFTELPKSYPSSAWYTYDDPTCEYNCQTAEYFYWTLTSVLGAQENRLNDIDNEWRLNTKVKVENTDPIVYKLLIDPKYKLPTVLPDGSYRH